MRRAAGPRALVRRYGAVVPAMRSMYATNVGSLRNTIDTITITVSYTHLTLPTN